MKYHKYMIKMKRKGLSAKGITIIALVLIIALGIATAVVTIFALSGHTMLSSVKISYTATDIDGSASVTYQLLSEDGTNDGEVVSLGSIEFKANNTTNPTQNLSPAKTLELSTTQPYVEFTYTFNNTGSLDYIATLTFVDVIQDTNIGFDYKYKEYEYGTENFAILVQGVETSYSQATYKVKMKVEDVALDVNWNGVFNWELKAFEADTIEEQKSVRAMDYTENGSGTYTANYNGGKLENNTLVISGNVGGINVTSVGQIRNLPQLSKVVIGEGITTIESSAFAQQNVSNVELPDSLENIGDNSFYLNNFKSVTIPKSVTKIGEGAFAFCYMLEEYIVEEGNTVYSVDENCLIENGTTLHSGCYKSVIPNYITHIAYRAFMGHTNLTTINIPKSVQTMDTRGVFDYCSNFESYTAEVGGAFVVDGNCLIKGTVLYAGCKNSVIPNYVTEIGTDAFCGHNQLASIVIPDSVELVNSYAFFACRNLLSVTLGKGLKYIASAAFAQTKITTLTIPSNVEIIGNTSFAENSSLTEIYVLSTNENLSVYYGAFNGVTAKFYCCLSGPGVNWNANWQDSLTEIHWNYIP